MTGKTGMPEETTVVTGGEGAEERARYFRKISRIYAAQGHEDESLRYLAFAEQLEDEEGTG